MKTKITIIALVVCSYTFGQKTTFFKDDNIRRKASEKDAKFKEIKYIKDDTLIVQFIKISGNVLLEESKWKDKKPVGIWKTFDYNGNKNSERDFNSLVYSKNPTEKIEIYDNDPLNKNCINCKPAEFITGIDGLLEFIRKEIKYPEESRELENSGTVYIRFIIEKDGTPIPHSILKGVDSFIDLEVWQLIGRMPKWNPAKKNEETIESYFNLPVKFNLR